MIEGHGDDLYRYGAKVMHNFSTNIISDSDHSGLISYLHSVMSKIGSYPEPAPYSPVSYTHLTLPTNYAV